MSKYALKIENKKDSVEKRDFWVGYLKDNLLEQSARLVKSELKVPAFVFYAQLIELFGVFFDNKPLRVKEQARKRFNQAIVNLFSKEYVALNHADWLYLNYRCSMIHALLPSPFVILLTQKEVSGTNYKHLQKLPSGKLVLVLEDLQQDVEKALTDLVFMLENEEVAPKETGLLN